jgi:hypothetical protein
MDGNVYGWAVNALNSSSNDNRIDIVTANNRTSTLAAMAIDCPSTPFTRIATTASAAAADESGGRVLSDSDRRWQVILSSADGNIKVPSFSVGKAAFSAYHNLERPRQCQLSPEACRRTSHACEHEC